MSKKVEMSENAIRVLFADSYDAFFRSLTTYLKEQGATAFTVWEVNGVVCEPKFCEYVDIMGSLDVFDLGYDNAPFTPEPRNIHLFDKSVPVMFSVFFRKHDRVHAAVTFHHIVPAELINELKVVYPYFSTRVHELIARDRQIDVYIEYQKKIEFIKEGSRIFKALDIDNVIAVALSYFMEVFSAEAVCAQYQNTFVGIGIDESDSEHSIRVDGTSLKNFLQENKRTEFLEERLASSKFNIHNAFFVYEETVGLQFALFNIRVDLVPDKELSELVGSIVSIAVENAKYHENMTHFKVEEAEMTQTVDILNRFVSRTFYQESNPEIFGVNYPARKAGGDYFIVRQFDDRIFFCVADVCGKGYSAAVFTVVLSVLGETLFNGTMDELKSFVQQVNSFILSKNFEFRFITAFFGLVDLTTNELQYISCGHEPALLISGDDVQELTSESLPLGIDTEDYSLHRATIQPGSLLFTYTDGVIEYIDYDALYAKVRTLKDNSPKEIVGSLYSELVTDREQQRDDFTCVVLKFA